ncbi:MAG: hypothetical protein H7338_23370 [Candidatus Sericytochromatia bacterium]|nr:hypothetical protein [Candidatus Sericytochromatia bacterium]
MQKLMTLLVLAGVAFSTACTASNPIQRELGNAARLELTNNTNHILEMDLVVGTTSSELQKDEIITHVSLAPGEHTNVQTYPGRYTLFPQQGDETFGKRSMAFSGVQLSADQASRVAIGEREMQTISGKAQRLTFKNL